MRTSEQLRQAAASVDMAIELRNALVLAMRNEGATLREIAKAASLSPQGVKKILDREGEVR
jgi:hypothetical protein